jgi:hypothetical protein
MNRKFAPFFVLLTVALVTLACSPCGLLGGGSEPAPENTVIPSATEPPAVEPTAPAAEPTAPATEEGPDEYDTAFPLPDDVQNFIGDGGESDVSFQTSLSMDEAIEFYRQALSDMGLTEYEVLTVIEDEGFSLVFTSWPNGEELVLQGVDFGDTINVSIRLEEVVESAATTPPETETGLGEEQRSEAGGFAFQPIPGYTVEEMFGFASMEAPDADSDVGPAIMLIGSAVEESMNLEELYGDFVTGLEAGVGISEPRAVTVGGVPGLAVDMSGDEGGQEFAGRIVFVAVSPTQNFTMFGMASPDRWDDELAPLFDAMMDSISFFEPTGG